jgi:hypothetical protein
MSSRRVRFPPTGFRDWTITISERPSVRSGLSSSRSYDPAPKALV